MNRMQDFLTAETVVIASTDQVWCALDGDAAILHLKTGVYYGLESVGAAIWELLQKPTTVNAICEAISAEYEVSREQCERDVYEFLSNLMTAGLVTVSRSSVV